MTSAEAEGGTTGSASRRELAVARVLNPARQKAETRVQAFLDAARELANSESGPEFTIQEVIERSGQSLRSFYQHFDGKYDLLLAVFEDAVESATSDVRALIADAPSPLERLHRFVVEYSRLCLPPRKGKGRTKGLTRVLSVFAQELLTEHPQDASRAFIPIRALLLELLEDAAAAGAIRPDFDRRWVAGVMLQAIMFNSFAAGIGGFSPRPETGDPAEHLWELLMGGLKR